MCSPSALGGGSPRRALGRIRRGSGQNTAEQPLEISLIGRDLRLHSGGAARSRHRPLGRGGARLLHDWCSSLRGRFGVGGGLGHWLFGGHRRSVELRRGWFRRSRLGAGDGGRIRRRLAHRRRYGPVSVLEQSIDPAFRAVGFLGGPFSGPVLLSHRRGGLGGYGVGIRGSPFRHGWRGIVRLSLSGRFGRRGSVRNWISLGRRGLRNGWSRLRRRRRRYSFRSVGKGRGRSWRVLDPARLARVQVIRVGGVRRRSGQNFDVDDDRSALSAAARTRQGDQHGKDRRDAEPMHGSGAKQAKRQGDGSSFGQGGFSQGAPVKSFAL
jgi:hypothetical protein